MSQAKLRIVFSLILSLSFISVSVYIIKFKKPKTESATITTVEQESVTLERNPQILKDSDGDGLMDWEEDLWKTDKNKKDTDGDRVSDFDEIRAGRNPLVAGDGKTDKLDAETVAKKINPVIESDLSETEKFGREFFAKYIGSINSGQPVDYKNALAARVAETNPINNVKPYEDSDFKIIEMETAAIARAYGNKVGEILSKNTIKDKENELILTARAVNENNQSLLKDLDKTAIAYDNIAKGLKTIEVPRSALEIHKKMANLFMILAEEVRAMKFSISDPIKALGGLSTYPDTLVLLDKTMREMRDYLAIRQANYESFEYGAIFSR
jgi:hypothetical protein